MPLPGGAILGRLQIPPARCVFRTQSSAPQGIFRDSLFAAGVHAFLERKPETAIVGPTFHLEGGPAGVHTARAGGNFFASPVDTRAVSRARFAILLLLFVALPLGAAPLEIASGLALALALLGMPRAVQKSGLLGPVAAVALAWLGSALGRDPALPALVEAAGRTWPLALVIAVPTLAEGLEPRQLRRVETVGLGVAAAVAALAWVPVVGGLWPWESPERGLFSHHLTLGYALLPACARALAERRWGFAAAAGLGIAAAGSSGPLLALVVAGAALVFPARAALVGGVGVALVLMRLLAADPDLHQRAVLWSSGAALATTSPLGVGPLGYRAAVEPVQRALEPGFYFPMHAHDAALQIAALAGFGAWIAWIWLVLEIWRRGGRAGQAALAGLLVGGLTQDTLGDLEVIRAACAWALLPALLGTAGADRGRDRADLPAAG